MYEKHANHSLIGDTSIFLGFEHQFKTSSKVLELSIKILKDGGKYLARVRFFNHESDNKLILNPYIFVKGNLLVKFNDF